MQICRQRVLVDGRKMFRELFAFGVRFGAQERENLLNVLGEVRDGFEAIEFDRGDVGDAFAVLEKVETGLHHVRA